MKLLRGRRPVESIFNLLGTKEDDMTYALGFVASRSPEFASGLVAAASGGSGDFTEGLVRLQEIDGDGRTDVEIELADWFHGVFEAKRGPSLPTVRQLEKYTPRLRKRGSTCQRLIAVTNASQQFAAAQLAARVDGIPVVHLSWRAVRRVARAARRNESHPGTKTFST